MRSLISLSLSVALLFFHFSSFGQQDIIVQPDNGIRGQRLNVLFSGVNVNFAQATGIQLFFTQGPAYRFFRTYFTFRHRI